jgi:hypothetical protein
MPYAIAMGKPAADDILDLDQKEVPQLIKAIEDSLLSPRHKAILQTLISQMMETDRLNREKMAHLRRIKRMLAKKTEKKPQPTKKDPDAEPKKGHGRNGVEDYQFATVVPHAHHLKIGQVCPDCGHGTLQGLEPRKAIRLKGNAPIIAELHEPERLRCSGCGEVFTAELPPEVGEEKADSSAKALVAVFRYGMGIPHTRLAAMQLAMGVPLPPSTQYEMVEMLWTHVVPVYKELLRTAADWPLLFVDDTTMKILDLLKDKQARKAAGERVGVFTTGIVARKEGREIHLFFTGRKHAGENLGDLLDLRDPDLPEPIQVSDALSRNVPKDHLTRVVLCLVHGRRNFYECEDAYPDESTFVLTHLAMVYKHERQARQKGLTDEQRLAHHQALSSQPMEDIRAYAAKKTDAHEVEPNSVLGQAFKYLLNHWEGLTQFLRIPGAPLDNNDVERLIKRAILHRKNSLFYKTENGAHVGDVLMSLIQTCQAVGTNPFDYLTTLDRNFRHVAKNPHLWLPWNYQSILKSLGPPSPKKTPST